MTSNSVNTRISRNMTFTEILTLTHVTIFKLVKTFKAIITLMKKFIFFNFKAHVNVFQTHIHDIKTY